MYHPHVVFTWYPCGQLGLEKFFSTGDKEAFRVVFKEHAVKIKENELDEFSATTSLA